MTAPADPARILILRFGSLGDSVVALPALAALRRRFPAAYIGFCSERVRDKTVARPVDILGGRGIIDEFLYWPRRGPWLTRRFAQLQLAAAQRRAGWDFGIALEEFPPETGGNAAFYRKILNVLGSRSLVIEKHPPPGSPRCEALVRILRPLGIPSAPGLFGMLRSSDNAAADAAAGELLRSIPDGAPLLAVAPTSNMPAKRWPLDRYRRVIAELVREHFVCPIFFGAQSEEGDLAPLFESSAHSVRAFGQPIPVVLALLRRCRLYLGNDNGVMHLANAAGLPCVAIFSARDAAGRWHPDGPGHSVFRTDIDCAGCMLVNCIDRKMECIMRIDTSDVLSACRSHLATRHSST